MKAILVLEDGSRFIGEGFGYQGVAGGEVIFNTGMVGHQHVVTDPCYSGQLVVFTYPMIGNYGVSPSEAEGARAFTPGLVVREVSEEPNNWKMEMTLNEYLQQEKVVGISQVDTRQLTRLLREKGSMLGIISSRPQDVDNPDGLLARIKELQPVGWPEIKAASTPRVYKIEGSGPLLAVVDLGIKRSLLKLLQETGCRLVVVPADTSIAALEELGAAGLFFSNGPGDPRQAMPVIEAVKHFMGHLPIAGVGLGHQILALALGLEVTKMHFGHHGANHPVKETGGTRVSITAQHHNYVVKDDNVPGDVEITRRHLNDHTVEGLCHKRLPIYSVQYHPQDKEEFIRVFQGFLTSLSRKGGS